MMIWKYSVYSKHLDKISHDILFKYHNFHSIKIELDNCYKNT